MGKKTMQRNIDEKLQRKRKNDAVISAVVSSLWFAISAVIMLVLRNIYLKDNFWGAVLLILSIIELAMIVPVWILLKTRLKEIEGGEEDVASKY